MKKNKILLASLAIALTLNLTSCSKDDEATTNNNNNTSTVATASTNGALVDGMASTKVTDPIMTDKTAVLATTAGIFTMEFASKPTESGTYNIKSSLSAARDLVAAPVKEVTFKFTDLTQMAYTASAGTVMVTIKDGKITIDVKDISVCRENACKKTSVKYDFAYTPPTTTVDPVDPNPTPSTEAPGTGIIDGVKTTDTKYNSTGTFLSLPTLKSANLAVDGGTFQIRFKEKPTTAGTYKVTLDSPSTPLASNEVVFSYVPQTNTDFDNYYTSGVNSTGSVTVKISGDKLIIEAVNIKAFKNSDKAVSKTFSAYLSIAK